MTSEAKRIQVATEGQVMVVVALVLRRNAQLAWGCRAARELQVHQSLICTQSMSRQVPQEEAMCASLRTMEMTPTAITANTTRAALYFTSHMRQTQVAFAFASYGQKRQFKGWCHPRYTISGKQYQPLWPFWIPSTVQTTSLPVSDQTNPSFCTLHCHIYATSSN